MVSKVKVLFIIPTIHPGGIETYLLRFLTHFKKDTTISPIVLVRSFEKGHLFSQYNKLNIPIHFRPLGKINFSNILWYYRFFKNEKFDAICDFNANFSGISMFLANITKIKKRITFYRQGRNHYTPTFLNNIYNQLLNKLVNKYSTQILSNSKASLDYFFPRWNNDSRFKVIYNGIKFEQSLNCSNNEVRQEQNIPLNAFVISHSGRLDKAKNHETILKVARELIQYDKNIYFIILGLGTEMLQSEIEDLQIETNVRLLGFRNDVQTLLSSSDLFYFPSITEGQPNALIEAMLLGIPIVASNIDTIKETLPINLYSFLIDPLDIKKAVQLIKDIKIGREVQNTEMTKKCAELQYSQDLRFKEFYQTLII
jgi:glycosyltransferase involved in cell wall biosynthesis